MSPKRVIDILHREIRGLHEAAYLLAFFTFGSQLFALMRDRLLAHHFGIGSTLDIFYAAFRIPDTIYAVLASMVSLFVLIPFMETARQKSKDGLREFISDMFSFFSIALVFLGVLAWIFTPQIVDLLYKNFSPSMQNELVSMIRILLLQPFLLGVSNLFAAYVQIRGRFLLYSVAPILYNLGIIIGIIFISPVVGDMGLAWGVVLGACMHLGVQVPFMLKNRMFPRLKLPNRTKVFEVIKVSIPRTITLSSQQIVLLVMVSFASMYASGSVSSLNFAWNLQSVPLAIIGVSYSVAAFPKLAELFAKKEIEEYKKLILVASRQIIFWAVPVVVFVVVLRAQIVRVILGASSKFGWDATKMTSAILAILVVSLVAQGLVVLLVRACYAAGKTLVPLVINVISSLVTVFLIFVLLHLSSIGFFDLKSFTEIMRVSGVLSGEILLIALSYSLGSILNALLLMIYFEKKYGGFVLGLRKTFWQSVVASLVAGFGTYLSLNLSIGFVNQQTFVGVLGQGLVSGIIGICFWIVTLVALNNKDIIAAWFALQKKLTKKRFINVRGSIEGR